MVIIWPFSCPSNADLPPSKAYFPSTPGRQGPAPPPAAADGPGGAAVAAPVTAATHRPATSDHRALGAMSLREALRRAEIGQVTTNQPTHICRVTHLTPLHTALVGALESLEAGVVFAGASSSG